MKHSWVPERRAKGESLNLGEVKAFSGLHAQMHGISLGHFKSVLDRVDHLEGAGEGAWGFELKREAEAILMSQAHEAALPFYLLARFPFPSSPIQDQAYEMGLGCFNQLNLHFKLERLVLKGSDGELAFYFKPGTRQNARLILVMGGIISVKEQWLAFVSLAEAFDFALVLMEMPGVGENTHRYQSTSFQLLSQIMDVLQDRAGVQATHCINFSFSGHMAIQAACEDERIVSIFTIAAPIHSFFIDPVGWRQVPQLTRVTLAFLCQCEPQDLFEYVRDFALSSEALSCLKIPIHYVETSRDEIISAHESAYGVSKLSSFYLHRFDDVHGGPQHLQQIKQLMIQYLADPFCKNEIKPANADSVLDLN